MATFREMSEQLIAVKQKRAVLQYLIEHIDENFRPVAGGDSKNKLLTEDKLPVPAAIFEAVISEILLQVDGQLEAMMTAILESSIEPVPAAPPSTTSEAN